MGVFGSNSELVIGVFFLSFGFFGSNSALVIGIFLCFGVFGSQTSARHHEIFHQKISKTYLSGQKSNLKKRNKKKKKKKEEKKKE